MLLNQRNQTQKKTWELLRTKSLVEAVHTARDLGWAEKKVQVKSIPINDEEDEYYIEPFEKDCGCKNVLRYEDYFDAPNIE